MWYNIIIKEIPAISGFSTCWLEANRRWENFGRLFSFLFKYTYMYEETKLLFVAKYLVIKKNVMYPKGT